MLRLEVSVRTLISGRVLLSLLQRATWLPYFHLAWMELGGVERYYCAVVPMQLLGSAKSVVFGYVSESTGTGQHKMRCAQEWRRHIHRGLYSAPWFPLTFTERTYVFLRRLPWLSG